MRDRSGDRNKSFQSSDKYAVNEQITAKEVRLVGVESEQIGIVSREEALQKAEAAGVDLVEVAPDATPPVCRLLDYGKLKYREQKKAAEARKRSATQGVKELRIRYSTDKHDLETKVRKAREFIADGERVKFQMRFRGREVVYASLGRETFKKVAGLLEDIATVEETTPLVGRRMHIIFVPKPAK